MARMPDSHPAAGSSSPFRRDEGEDEEQRLPSIPRAKRSIASQTSRPERRKRGKHTSSFRSDEAHFGGSPVLRPLTPLTRPAYSAMAENQSRVSRNSLEHHARQNAAAGPSRVPPRAPTPPPPRGPDRLPRGRPSSRDFTSIGSWCESNPTPPRTRRPEHITLSESRNDGMISPSPEREMFGSAGDPRVLANSYQFHYAGEGDADRISNSACYITNFDRQLAAKRMSRTGSCLVAVH